MEQKEQFTRLVDAIESYYNQFDFLIEGQSLPFNKYDVNQSLIDMWIDSLAEPMKTNFRLKSFAFCLSTISFQRFALEMNDFSMHDYMKEHLSDEDYNFWLNC